MTKILIKGGRVWNGKEFLNADVLTNDKIICKIEKNICDSADYVFEADGKIVSAGLVDIHTHMKGISGDEFGISADMSTLPFGVCAAADASACFGKGEMLDFLTVKACVFVCGEIKENKAYFDSVKKGIEKYKDKVVGIKVYFDTNITDVSDATALGEVAEFARERNLSVMVHTSDSPVSMAKIAETLQKGDIITHAYHSGKNNCAEDRFECLKKAKKRGVYIDAGMAGHIHTDFEIMREAISSGFTPDIISTDITRYSAYKRGGRYGMTMCMSIAKHLGMREEDIFRAVTLTPAKALGKENEWGQLSKGRCADIAVFEYTNEIISLCDKAGNKISSSEGYRCVMTVADGEIVYKI